jgi:hypothetical protein
MQLLLCFEALRVSNDKTTCLRISGSFEPLCLYLLHTSKCNSSYRYIYVYVSRRLCVCLFFIHMYTVAPISTKLCVTVEYLESPVFFLKDPQKNFGNLQKQLFAHCLRFTREIRTKTLLILCVIYDIFNSKFSLNKCRFIIIMD